MKKLVIGVPAFEEESTVAQLVESLEVGCALLGEETMCELVMAYQEGGDRTLERWQSRRHGVATRVLHCPKGQRGKGLNVKLLIDHARQEGASLLLVDADLGSYPPANIVSFARPDRSARSGAVLPLWRRPAGEGNSTDFLAAPLLFASYGARVRQPLAGQMLLTEALLETIDCDALPDDYGIDIALTMHVLDRGLPVEQVAVTFPEHQGGASSHLVMQGVAAPMLRRLAAGNLPARTDVTVSGRWWDPFPSPPPSPRSLGPLIEEAVPDEEMAFWVDLLDGPPERIRDMWCDRLAAAVHGARRGRPAEALAAELVPPFLVHAEYRRRLASDDDRAEVYVRELGDHLAEAI